MTESSTDTKIIEALDFDSVVPCESRHSTGLRSPANNDGFPCEHEAAWEMVHRCGHTWKVCYARRMYWATQSGERSSVICLYCNGSTPINKAKWRKL